VDHKVHVIQQDLVEQLGDSLKRKLIKGVQEQSEIARSVALACSIPSEELRREWDIQKSAQRSVRSRKCLLLHVISSIEQIIDLPKRMEKDF
jgi:hypothetical protein